MASAKSNLDELSKVEIFTVTPRQQWTTAEKLRMIGGEHGTRKHRVARSTEVRSGFKSLIQMEEADDNRWRNDGCR